MGNKYEITLKDINQEIELLLTQLNLLIEACNNSNNIDDLFSELLAQIEKYKTDIFNYKRQDLPFIEDMNIYRLCSKLCRSLSLCRKQRVYLG